MARPKTPDFSRDPRNPLVRRKAAQSYYFHLLTTPKGLRYSKARPTGHPQNSDEQEPTDDGVHPD